MKILLTGATGTVGSAILNALKTSGHDVVAVVRSEGAAMSVEALGAEAVVHDLLDVPWMSETLMGVDGLIHAAAPTNIAPKDLDTAIIDAAIAAFSGTDKPFVNTGGMWGFGSSDEVITEMTPWNPAPNITWRTATEQRALTSGLNAMLVIPSNVYGRGRGFLGGILVAAPRTDGGTLLAIGTGEQYIENIYIDDLADLYVAVLDHGMRGESYIGNSGFHPTVMELTQAIAGPSGRVAPEGVEASIARLGAGFASGLMLNQRASSAKAQKQLHWMPKGPSIVDELTSGAYSAIPAG